MQSELSFPNESNSVADRLDIMYKCHESLEDTISLFSALQESTQESPHTVGNFNPWKKLETAVDTLSRDTISCLRVFSTSRELKSFRGMETVAALYARGNPPQVRLISFLNVIRDTCGGVLPPVVTIAACRHMMRIDYTTAAEFLEASVNEYVSVGNQNSDSFQCRLINIVVGGREKLLQSLPFLLRLEIECAAEAERPSVVFVEDNARIRAMLSESVLDNLKEFEANCRQNVMNKKQRLRERDLRRASLSASHRTDGVPSPIAPKGSAHAHTPLTVQDAPTSTAWYMHVVKTWSSGRKRYVAGTLIGLLVIILLRLLFLGVRRAVAYSLSASRPAQKRVLSF
ncbi:hypothetical protein STCU_00762 [Strigomonas culicis]|uniref:Uncharacterized protein n=1 Tax=Strigomonas culicis TaxID=28005 RepID=S9WA88_9TRYP|nr:hypothetical protein STCU_00762 [Strigomonas culicis]|eukprot:EPY36086.1 hypothetical protein STCU_00762 [Strigomonas culicis]